MDSVAFKAFGWVTLRVFRVGESVGFGGWVSGLVGWLEVEVRKSVVGGGGRGFFSSIRFFGGFDVLGCVVCILLSIVCFFGDYVCGFFYRY